MVKSSSSESSAIFSAATRTVSTLVIEAGTILVLPSLDARILLLFISMTIPYFPITSSLMPSVSEVSSA